MPIWMRVLLLALTAVGLLVWVKLAFRFRRRWLYGLVPITWLLNVLVFNAIALGRALGLNQVDVITLNVWSASITLQGVVMAVGIGAVLLAGIKGDPIDGIS